MTTFLSQKHLTALFACVKLGSRPLPSWGEHNASNEPRLPTNYVGGVSTLCGIELLHNYFTNGTFDMQE